MKLSVCTIAAVEYECGNGHGWIIGLARYWMDATNIRCPKCSEKPVQYRYAEMPFPNSVA